MNSSKRRTTLAAAVVVSAALTGCGGGQQPAAPAPGTPDSARPPTTAGPEPEATGLTRTSDIFGPQCNQIPASGPGSAAAMVSEPAGTAAGHNPQLSTLVKAAQASGLAARLNDPNATYTLFAPTNSAFQQLPPGTLDQLLKDKEKLTQVLEHHVVAQRYSADQLANADSVVTDARGSRLEFDGDARSLTIGGDQGAHVLCGNIPTKNATVFVIDKVLMPQSS